MEMKPGRAARALKAVPERVLYSRRSTRLGTAEAAAATEAAELPADSQAWGTHTLTLHVTRRSELRLCSHIGRGARPHHGNKDLSVWGLPHS